MQTDNYGSRGLEEFGTRRVELNLTDQTAGIQGYITGEYLEPPATVLQLGYILVSGVWKKVTSAYTTMSGAWKSVTDMDIVISSTWKGGVE